MMYPWAPYKRPLAANVSITDTLVHLELPPDQYTVNDPLVFVTVNGGPTEVSISSPLVLLAGVGEVHTYVDLTFPSSLIGKKAAVWVMGQ